MSDELFPPEPLVPAGVDLRDFQFMPLEFRRLFTSETWLLAKDSEKLAALALWCESWHQVPAASLPDNDRVLAVLSQAGSSWRRVKVHALRGWVTCSDGRLYHPVVAAKALEAWERKLDQRRRTHAARLKALDKRIAEAATDDERLLLHEQRARLLQEERGAVTGSKGQGQGQLKGQGSDDGLQADAVATSPGSPLADGERRPTVETWAAYASAYKLRYRVEPVRNKRVNGMLARFVERVPRDEAPDIAAFYVAHSKGLYVSSRHCVDLLLRDAEGLRTEWATGRRVTDAEARTVDKTAARADQVERLRSAA